MAGFIGRATHGRCPPRHEAGRRLERCVARRRREMVNRCLHLGVRVLPASHRQHRPDATRLDPALKDHIRSTAATRGPLGWRTGSHRVRCDGVGAVCRHAVADGVANWRQARATSTVQGGGPRTPNGAGVQDIGDLRPEGCVKT
jgi:hypothetical protein